MFKSFWVHIRTVSKKLSNTFHCLFLWHCSRKHNFQSCMIYYNLWSLPCNMLYIRATQIPTFISLKNFTLLCFLVRLNLYFFSCPAISLFVSFLLCTRHACSAKLIQNIILFFQLHYCWQSNDLNPGVVISANSCQMTITILLILWFMEFIITV